MILETYQEQQAVVPQEPTGQSFATVGTVYEDGITLIFNGAEAESLKHYKCNACVRFEAGQRVRIIEDSGTYVVEYPVGAPAQSVYADNAGRAAYATEAGYATTAGKAATASKADIATSAGSADTAKSAESAETAKTAESAKTAEQAQTAESAGNASNADNAKEAERALYVDNKATGIADIEFRYNKMGEICVRTTKDSQWTKLTGTIVNN